MNLGNLKELTRFYMTQLTSRKIDDATFTLMLNQGALDVATRLSLLPGTGSFNSEAGIGEYSLCEKLTDYLAIDKEGVYWKNNGTYEEIYPRTTNYFKNKYPNWMNDAAGSPQRYALRGDVFIPHPKPVSAEQDAFYIYYLKRPELMVSDQDYPYKTSDDSERTDLEILSELIILYAAWKILQALKEVNEAFNKRAEYLQEVEIMRTMINKRRDIDYSDHVKMSGPRV